MPFLSITGVSLTCILILYAAHRVVPELRSLHNFALLLWTLLVAQRAFIPRVEPLGSENLEWGPIVVAEVSLTISIFISCSALFLFRFRRSKCGGAPITVKFIFLYAAVAVLSLAYTPAPLPVGFWLLRLLSAVFLLAIYFDSVNDSQVARFAGWTCLAVIPYMLFPWIELIALKSVEGHRPAGLYVQTSIGSIMGYTIVIFCFFSWLENRRGVATLALGLVGLSSAYLAGGKAAAAAMATVLLFVFIANRRQIFTARGVAAILLACVVLALLAVSGAVGLVAHWQEYSGTDFATMRDRVELWQAAFSMWSNSPILGYSFTFIGIGISSPYGFTYSINNSYLQALVEVGLLGSLPFFSAIGIVLFRTLRLGIRAFRLKPLAPIASAWYLLILCSVSETVFGCPFAPVAYLFLGFLVCTDVLTQRVIGQWQEGLTRDEGHLLC